MEHSTFQEEAIEFDPQDAGTFFNRGVAYYGQGKLDLAIADFDRAIEINPQDTYAFNNREVVHMTQGKVDLAITDYDRAIEINPQFTKAFYNRGFLHKRIGNPKEAKEDLVNYLRLAESIPEEKEWVAEAKKALIEIADE